MMRLTVRLLLVSLLLLGCRRPVQVVTTSRICTDRVPVSLSADKIPVQVDLGDQPVRVETGTLPVKDPSPLIEMVVRGPKTCPSRIAIVDIDGLLLNKNPIGLASVGENPVALFREKLDQIASDPSYKGVLLRINSPGGGVTACDIMRRDLADFKGRTKLPIVACLMDVGAGGAYYIGTSADIVVAHPTTVIGGMGVILNLYDLEDALAVISIAGTPIKSGENVDLGTPVKRMSPEASKLLQQIADDFHARYRETVTAARPKIDSANDELFDGRVMTAQRALEAGLIDQVGYLDDAIESTTRLAQVAGEASVVVLHRAKDVARTAYDITPNTPAQSQLLPSISGLDRSHLPTFLYMWQPDPSIETSLGK